jgi:hypothetical protein
MPTAELAYTDFLAGSLWLRHHELAAFLDEGGPSLRNYSSRAGRFQRHRGMACYLMIGFHGPNGEGSDHDVQDLRRRDDPEEPLVALSRRRLAGVIAEAIRWVHDPPNCWIRK